MALGSIVVERSQVPMVNLTLSGACKDTVPYRVHFYETDQGGRLSRASLDMRCNRPAAVTLSPGAYHLVAATSQDELKGGGATALAVGTFDQQVQLRVGPPVEVIGAILVNGSSPKPGSLPPMQLRIQPIAKRTAAEVSLIPAVEFTEVNPNGTFTTSAPCASEGLVQITIPGLPHGLYVKEILYNGSRVGDVFDLHLYAPKQELQVLLSSDAAKMGGLVTDDGGKPIADARVLLVPAPMTLNSEYPVEVIESRTDSKGVYLFPALRPGDYRIVSVPAKLRQRFEEPNRLASVLAVMSTFSLKERDVVTRDLKVWTE
jgi:hypothetical protein